MKYRKIMMMKLLLVKLTNKNNKQRKLINDYNDIRKNGSKLRKRVVMILKQLEKGRRMNEEIRKQVPIHTYV